MAVKGTSDSGPPRVPEGAGAPRRGTGATPPPAPAAPVDRVPSPSSSPSSGRAANALASRPSAHEADLFAPKPRPPSAAATWLGAHSSLTASHGLPSYLGPAAGVLLEVLELDLDRDGELDARDEALAQARGIPFEVVVPSLDGGVERLVGAEQLAHAADVLSEAVRAQGPRAPIPYSALLEPRSLALARALSESFPALIRDMSTVSGLVKSLEQTNLPAPDGRFHIWVPKSDPGAVARLRKEAQAHNALHSVEGEGDGPPVDIEVFEPGMDWRELEEKRPGILYLPKPALVPGGRFQEAYGWDSYFMAQGLLEAGHTEQVAGVVENLAYLGQHYGRVPNSTRSYHVSRAHPPFMPRLALELYEQAPTPKNLALLRKVVKAAEKELSGLWYAAPRRTESGLSRYHDDAAGPDLEVQRNLVSKGVFTWPDPVADRAARESGWDLSHRFTDHAHLLEPVDLNSLLFTYEQDLASLYRLVEGEDSTRAVAHDDAAEARRELLHARFWDETLGLFTDFDLKTHARTGYESLATFAPLAAGWATREQAERVVAQLPKFLEAGGLATSSRASREAAGGEPLQWDWPNGWAPLQVLAVQGLRRYGFDDEANEVAYRWLFAVLEIAGRNNGLIPEKLDVHRVSADVEAAEYGNQGEDRGSYAVPRSEHPQGFGWTNASFLTLRKGLPPRLRDQLDRGVPPAALFPARGLEREGTAAAG